jgi:hypothetical protein
VLITEKDAADVLRLKSKTLTRWRWEGRGPRYHKIGGAVRYRTEDLEAFIAGTAVQHG